MASKIFCATHRAVTLPPVQVTPIQPEHGSVVGSQLVSTVPFMSMFACAQKCPE